MLNETHILASGDGKDLLETVFFVVIAVISIFGSLIGKLLKKDESDEIAEDDFEESGEEESTELIPETTVDYGDTSDYDERLRERRRQTLLVQARAEAERRARFERLKSLKKTPAPPKAKSVPEKKSTPKSNDGNAGAELFSDREALRRAVLAQEILSPPLALRESSEPK